MVNAKAIIALVLVVLPAIILAASSPCSVSVTFQQTSANNLYTTYSASATNNGQTTVTNIKITPSTTLKSLSGLTQSGSVFTISTLAAGASKTFTFRAKNTVTIQWSTQCSGSSSVTTAPKASTSAPVAQSTTAPKATSAPSSSSSAGGRICPAGSWWAPSPLTTWQWQLTGTVDTTKSVQMYDIDLFDASASLVSTLHSKGKVVICYFSTQYENWRPDASLFTKAVIGKALDGWEGENYVDIRSTVVRNAINARLDLAVSKGCDGVEPDNVDGFTASTGFPVTAADQISFNTYIANQAHARGLSVGLKNDGDQAKTLQPAFDWALNEQCYEYSECDALKTFVTAGKAVFNTEYSGSGSTVCPYMNTMKISSLIKNLDLDASWKAQCCTYGSCAAAPYTCKTSMTTREVRNVDDETVAENDIEITNQEMYMASASTTYASVFVVAIVLAALNL